MDLYSFVKLLHILASVAWVGGAFLMAVMSELASRAPATQFQTYTALSARLGGVVFMPAAVLTLVFGIALTAMSWSFAELWIILALAGIAASMVMGVTVIKPTTEKVAHLAASEGIDSPEMRRASTTLLRFARLEILVMVVVIADMVFKPGYGDLVVLGAFAVVLAAGAIWLFGRSRRTAIAA